MMEGKSMRYILKDDYDNNDFDKVIEVKDTKELESKIGNVKGYGIEICEDERADGIVYIER